MMSSSSESVEKVMIRSCRICLDSEYCGYIKLIEGNELLQRFEYCFNLKLKAEDQPFLYRVCYKCAVEINKFCAFKEKCLSSQKLWECISDMKCPVDRLNFKQAKDAFFTLYDRLNQNVQNDENLCDFNNDISNDSVYSEYIKENRDEMVKIEDKNYDEIIQSVGSDFTCTKCFKSYTSSAWYVRHLALCKSNEEFSSNTVCKSIKTDPCLIPDTFKSNGNVKDRYILYKKPTIQPTKNLCGICKFSSASLEDLNKHLDEHWNNNELQCQMCEFTAKDQAGLATHRFVHHESKSKDYYRCHICQKKGRSELSLQFHYRKDHLNKPGGLCSQPNCNKEYNSLKLWNRHEKVHVHPGYICDICGNKYKYKHLILEHISRHISLSTHVCDLCGKVSTCLRTLKVHIKTVHQRLPDPVKCSHCNRIYKNSFQLHQHQRLLTMAKTLKCEFCPMAFSKMHHLKSHLKSHSEERPFCCHICGSRYKAKSGLVIHMRKHTGDRPFKCDLCVKTFISGAQLKVHKISHTKIFPLKCLYCEKSFRYKQHMLAHCALKHKLESIK